MVDNHKIPVYWPSNMNNEYESEWKYDSKQDKVINVDSAFIFLMVRVVRLASNRNDDKIFCLRSSGWQGQSG